jgi:tetratricopeptide (TPR) repeat protein
MSIGPEAFDQSPVTRFESMLQSDQIYFFDATEFEEIIQFYIDSGNLGTARKALEIGKKQHPDFSGLRLLHVELMLLNNQFEEAEKIIDAVGEMEPYNETVYLHKAVILSKTMRHQEAIEFLKTGMAYAEDALEFHSLLAMEYLYLDSFIMAKEHFIKCIELDPKDTHAMYNIIYCFESLEDTDGAIAFLNEFLAKDPYNEVGWHQLGRQYNAKNQAEQALTAFDFAIICDDAFIGAYFEMGKTLEKLNRWNEAILAYETTLQIDDPTSFALLRIGQCHRELENFQLALRFFKNALHEDPLSEKAWIALIDLYLSKNNHKQALYYLKKSIHIDNTNIELWKRYADTHKSMGFLEEADVAYSECVNLGNYELNTFVQWADVLKEMQEYKRAAEVLHQGLEFYPENSMLNFRLAGVYLLNAQSHEARFFLKNGYLADAKELENFYLQFPQFKSSSFVKNSLPINL